MRRSQAPSALSHRGKSLSPQVRTQDSKGTASIKHTEPIGAIHIRSLSSGIVRTGVDSAENGPKAKMLKLVDNVLSKGHDAISATTERQTPSTPSPCIPSTISQTPLTNRCPTNLIPVSSSSIDRQTPKDTGFSGAHISSFSSSPPKSRPLGRPVGDASSTVASIVSGKVSGPELSQNQASLSQECNRSATETLRKPIEASDAGQKRALEEDVEEKTGQTPDIVLSELRKSSPTVVEQENRPSEMRNNSVEKNSTTANITEQDRSQRRLSSYLICCKPTMMQISGYENAMSSISGKDWKATRRLLRRLCIHPSLVSDDATEGPVDFETSSKFCLLTRLILGADRSRIGILCCEEETRELLRQWICTMKESLCSEVPLYTMKMVVEDPTCLDFLDTLICFDQVPKVDRILLLNLGRRVETHQACIYHLITAGTLEELEVLDDLIGIDLDADLIASNKPLPSLSFSSQILTCLKERESRYRRLPEEEFAELWPTLLNLGWHAEPGSGLVDYFYCKPNITSRSGKSHKQKGKKHEDFFVSKEKVLAHLKQHTTLRERLLLAHGLNDLATWERHSSVATVQDDCLKNIVGGAEDISLILSLSGIL